MSLFTPSSNLTLLQNSIIVLTGGSSGIGFALVKYLRSLGAHVWSGDLKSPLDEETDTPRPAQGSSTYLRCDVSRYSDIHTLFRTAYDKHGRVDHAVSCAGVLERGHFFDEHLSIEDVAKPCDQTTLDINLQGSLSFARIASVFLRQGGRQRNNNLTFMSSIAWIRDSPGMPLYQTSKVAILRLVRGMRNLPICRVGGIRVNAICPGMTESAMTTHLIPRFREAEEENSEGLRGHWQTSMQVAEITARLILSGLNGKSLYIEGGKAWDFEAGLQDNMEAWLGEEPTKWLRENREFTKGLGGIRKD